MSSAPRPPLLAFGLTDPAPSIVRDCACTPASVAADCHDRPALLCFGLADRIPSYSAASPLVPRFVWGAAPADPTLVS